MTPTNQHSTRSPRPARHSQWVRRSALAFRYQPRLRAQLETSLKPEVYSRSFFRRSYRPWPRITTWVSLASGSAANRFHWGRASRDSVSCLDWERYPLALTLERTSSWPSSRFSGCSLTSAVGWAATSKHVWPTTSLNSRPIRLPNGGERSRDRILQRPQEPSVAADRTGCSSPRRGRTIGRS